MNLQNKFSEETALYSIATRVIDSLNEMGLETSHDETGEPFARFRKFGNNRAYRIRSRQFISVINKIYWKKTGFALSREVANQVEDLLHAQANFGSDRKRINLRYGGDTDRLIVDVGDELGNYLIVTGKNWEIASSNDNWFQRSPGMKNLPLPSHLNNDLEALKHYIPQIQEPDDWSLVLAWLISSMQPSGTPFPILLLHGSPGSGKSTAARILRSLIDPAVPELRGEPRTLRDLMAAARASFVMTIDNLSHVRPWLRDALCCISTGSGAGVRRLRSDEDEILTNVSRPKIITSTSDIISQHPDLRDRTLRIGFNPLSAHYPESNLFLNFEACKPGIYSSLIQRLAGAIRERNNISLKGLPRMADAARLAIAAEKAAGEAPNVLAAWHSNIGTSSLSALEASPIGIEVLEFFQRGRFDGSAKNLLLELTKIAGEKKASSRGWPKSPRKLAAELKRIEPALKDQGIEVIRPIGAERGRDRHIWASPFPEDKLY